MIRALGGMCVELIQKLVSCVGTLYGANAGNASIIVRSIVNITNNSMRIIFHTDSNDSVVPTNVARSLLNSLASKVRDCIAQRGNCDRLEVSVPEECSFSYGKFFVGFCLMSLLCFSVYFLYHIRVRRRAALTETVLPDGMRFANVYDVVWKLPEEEQQNGENLDIPVREGVHVSDQQLDEHTYSIVQDNSYALLQESSESFRSEERTDLFEHAYAVVQSNPYALLQESNGSFRSEGESGESVFEHPYAVVRDNPYILLQQSNEYVSEEGRHEGLIRDIVCLSIENTSNLARNSMHIV
ncbi:hypothetical protein K6025_05180 [Ehrlichia sp. JZT12]